MPRTTVRVLLALFVALVAALAAPAARAQGKPIHIIVTFTPGTAWVQLSADNRVLLLHVLAIQVKHDRRIVQPTVANLKRVVVKVFQRRADVGPFQRQRA